MKNVLLCTDHVSAVYAVPDPVAENLEEYGVEFCENWLWSSPDAARYRTRDGLCYEVSDFIDYLNRHVFPEQPSHLVQDISHLNPKKSLPQEYRELPCFLF